MVRKVLALAALGALVGSADAALVCHDTHGKVITCVHRPIAKRVVVRRTYHRYHAYRPYHPRGRTVLRCHDAHGHTIVCKK